MQGADDPQSSEIVKGDYRREFLFRREQFNGGLITSTKTRKWICGIRHLYDEASIQKKANRSCVTLNPPQASVAVLKTFRAADHSDFLMSHLVEVLQGEVSTCLIVNKDTRDSC